MLTPVRVVCANTLGMALEGRRTSNAISVRHTQSVGSRTVEAAATLFSQITERYQRIAAQYQTLKAMRLDEEMFRRLVLDVALPLPTPEPGEKISKWTESAIAKTAERRTVVRNLWDSGAGHTGDHSGWEAYNALTQATDHAEAAFPVRGSRVQALLDGKLGETKQAVLDSLLAAA